MRGFNFEVKDGTIHILDYPNADKVLALPDDKFIIQLKDYELHWWDLSEAKHCLEATNDNYPDIINRALIQNAVILFYKCFGQSKFRNNSLKKDKILAGYPPEAKAVFDYYKNLRDKFIAHDESRYAQVLTGGLFETKKEYPFVDVVSTIAVAETIDRTGVSSFYRLVLVTLQWVESKIDNLTDLVKSQYRDKRLPDIEGLKPLQLNVPTEKDIFEKRY